MILFTACSEDPVSDDAFNAGKDLVISSGFIAGWGAGCDSLIVCEDRFSYGYGASFPEPESIDKEGEVLADDWSQLVSSLDFDTFSKIDINTCYVCADGADYWVTVRLYDQTHTIRYGQNEDDLATVAPVSDFLEQLELLKAKLLAD
jgi:hypothetical protein